jgi:hypothetical protein
MKEAMEGRRGCAEAFAGGVVGWLVCLGTVVSLLLLLTWLRASATAAMAINPPFRLSARALLKTNSFRSTEITATTYKDVKKRQTVRDGRKGSGKQLRSATEY